MPPKRFVIAALLFWCLPVGAQDRTCTPTERTAADKQLFLNTRDKNLAIQVHLPWGVPSPVADDGVLLAHREYVIHYSNTLRIPLWTAHKIEPKGLNKVPGRIGCFRQDPRINSPKASLPSDYDEPDFDQGHLAPSEDLSHRILENVNSFVMSNMSPQHGAFNRTTWKRLETRVRTWAITYRAVYVISGSIFDRDNDGSPDAVESVKLVKARNGSRRVAIPSHFYKIVVRQCPDGKLATIAFVLPNEKRSRTGAAAEQFLVANLSSIKDIESLTGLAFFGAPDADGKIDRTGVHGMWPLKPPAVGSSGSDACGDT